MVHALHRSLFQVPRQRLRVNRRRPEVLGLQRSSGDAVIAPSRFEEFEELVREMRAAQKEFFKRRREGYNSTQCRPDLERAREFERQVDVALSRWQQDSFL